MKDSLQDETVAVPFYIDLNRQELKQVRLYIKDENMTEATFLQKTVYCTLHLRQQNADRSGMGRSF